MKKTLFLIFSGAIVIFSVICICSAPILNKVTIDNIFEPSDLGYLNCQKDSDDYKKTKEVTSDKEILKPLKHKLNVCNRYKAVYGLEHASLILDVFLGFLCLILGLLHYFDVGKPFEKVTGIIGLATGIIQFILTLVYICYSGYIFTNDGPESTSLPKAHNDGAVASWDGSNYKCDYYDKDDAYALYAKYSDLGKKAYNYDKDIFYNEPTNKAIKCPITNIVTICNSGEGKFGSTKLDDCEKLYYVNPTNDKVENKYLYDRWVTTIIFACFIVACDIGLAIFGFLLFKSDTSGL